MDFKGFDATFIGVERNDEITVVLAFLARYRPISVAVPSPYRRRPYGTLLPQRDSPFQKKGRYPKASHSVLESSVPKRPMAF